MYGYNFSTVPYQNSTTQETYVRPFTEGVTIFSGVIIFLFCIIGIILNTTTILVIRTSPKLRNVFMLFITSLCVSDLMSALISPLFWYRRTVGFDVWMPPNFFCKLFWAVDTMTTFSTSMHILNFAFLRLISIQHPTFFQRITKRGGLLWVLATWLIAFLCGFVTMWLFTGADPGVKRDRYSGEPNARWPACTLLLATIEMYKMFSLSSYNIFILLPMFAVAIVSVWICRSVHSRTKFSTTTDDVAIKKRVRKEKQAVLQLVLIVCSFIFGYLPFVTYELWATQTDADPVADYWFGLCQYFCLRLSECMNPVFYNISSSKMRRYTKRYVSDACNRCRGTEIRRSRAETNTSTFDTNEL